MYTDEELVQLEQEEYDLTTEEFLLMLLILSDLKVDVEAIITSFYQKYGENGVVAYQDTRKRVSNKDKRKRLFVLFYAIADTFDTSFLKFEVNFKNHLRSLIQMEMDFFKIELDDIDTLLEAKWGADNLSWYDRLVAHRSKWTTVLYNDMKKAFLQKKDIIDVLDDLEDRIESMEKALWKLYQTESSAINAIARKEIFKLLGVKEYRFYTREDERTCKDCNAMHGLVFPMTAYEVGVTASPIHARCRCFEIPILE